MNDFLHSYSINLLYKVFSEITEKRKESLLTLIPSNYFSFSIMKIYLINIKPSLGLHECIYFV